MKVTVPTSWEDVSIKQFIEIAKVPELGFDEWDSQLKVLEILTGVSDSVYYDMPLVELKLILNKTSFINSKPEYKGIKHRIKLAGQRYQINYEPKSLTYGEYVDLQEYIKDGTNKNLHKIIAIYLHPVNIFGRKVKKYYKKNHAGQLVQTLESRERNANLIYEHMKMSDVWPMTSFFLNLWGGLIKATRAYLEKTSKKAQENILKELKKMDLPSNTHGI